MRRFPLTRRLGLRARITLAFAIGALLLSVILSITTLALTRENLLNQREDAATVVVYENAGIVQQQAGQRRTTPRCSARCARRSGPGRSSTTAATSCRATRSSARTPSRTSSATPWSTGSRAGCASSSAATCSSPSASRSRRPTSPTSRSCPSSDLEDTLERARRQPARRVAGHHPRRRRHRLVGEPPGAPTARRRVDRRHRAGRPAASTPGSSRATTPTCDRSPRRSTTWPRRCRTASRATPGSPPT